MPDMPASLAMPPSTTLRGPSAAIAALVLGLVVLGVLFADEARAAVGVWIDSTAYGHCFFIIPIALFLAWERRHVAAATPVRPMPWMALAALPFGVVWLLAERLGLMEGQQIAAMGFVLLLFLVVLGWRMWRALAVPLLYLGFLVPAGAFITPALQDFTAGFVTHGLDVLGIANYTDGYIIEIPEGTFFVAEACAGLRFLIASIAFGVLYACMIYRSATKRVLFIAASVAIPIIANGFRGLGIVALGHVLGSAEAAAVDHVLYGWIFFSIVIVVLILAGLPFREDNGPLPVPNGGITPPAPAARPVWCALVALLALTAIAPAAAGWLDVKASTMPQTLAGPGPLAGCVATAAQPGSGSTTWAYACDDGTGAPLALSVTAFSARANSGALTRLRRIETGELSAEDATISRLPAIDAPIWQVMTTTAPDRIIAFAEWIDGQPSPGGLAARRRQAWNSITGGEAAPVLVTIATPPAATHLSPPARQATLHAITGLLQANPDLPATITRLAHEAASRTTP